MHRIIHNNRTAPPPPPIDFYNNDGDGGDDDKRRNWDGAPYPLYAVMASNDGRFELFEGARGLRVAFIAERGGLVGGFVRTRFCPADARWRAAAAVRPSEIVRRYALVCGTTNDCDVERYAAELACDLAGLTEWVKRLDRQPDDGRFRCPHCTAAYAHHFKYEDHLREKCGDIGAALLVSSDGFKARNGASIKAFRRIQAERGGTCAR